MVELPKPDKNRNLSNRKLLIRVSIGTVAFILLLGIGGLIYTQFIGDKYGSGGMRPDDSQQDYQSEEIVLNRAEPGVYEEETEDTPYWITDRPDETGPWFQDLYIAESNDGLNFTSEKLFVPHAGVGHILLTGDNKVIATFQYFSYRNESFFDKIAYTISEDYGKTWSDISPVQFGGLESGSNDEFMHNPNPVDPFLVELEDGDFRLYFTYHPTGLENPTLFSAKADDIDKEFKSEGQQLDYDGMILDPAVIKFGGTWHHFTTFHEESGENGKSDDGTGPNQRRSFHSISNTGLDFTKQTDIYTEMSFLGDVIEVDGKLRFYGSGEGVKSATSSDGYNWTMDDGQRVDGADPGVVELPDGHFLIIYTSMGK